ncbi:hypothetical protein DOY81_011771 [Sarcophaga bullata]|nr:hypothetical protein DOY81_011771 [Sarcophaga bullata]
MLANSFTDLNENGQNEEDNGIEEVEEEQFWFVERANPSKTENTHLVKAFE